MRSSRIRHVLSEYYDRIDELARRGEEFYGVPTGFIDLDKILGGLQASDLLIIAGRPGARQNRNYLPLRRQECRPAA